MNSGKRITWEVLENGCWKCTSHSTDYSGYPRLTRNGRLENMSRYIYKKHNGDLSDDLVVRHKCDYPTCINPEHLLKGTHQDNSHDRDASNHTARGERHGKAKVTEEIVRAIRSDHTHTLMQLKDIYGLSFSGVRYIKRGYSWKHI